MTSTKETRARQSALNAPDCPFIGHCSCCERRGLIDKPQPSPCPTDVSEAERIPAKRQMQARRHLAKSTVVRTT